VSEHVIGKTGCDWSLKNALDGAFLESRVGFTIWMSFSSLAVAENSLACIHLINLLSFSPTSDDDSKTIAWILRWSRLASSFFRETWILLLVRPSVKTASFFFLGTCCFLTQRKGPS
jgi:hypothetical protein